MDDLRSRIAKAEEAKVISAKEEEEKQAAAKIQIFQEEAEDSYIIPEKYLKMIEDIEDQDDDDDFSYMISDVSSSDDMTMGPDSTEDDDMDSLMVSVPLAAVKKNPSISHAPPPPSASAKKPTVSQVAPKPAPATKPKPVPPPVPITEIIMDSPGPKKIDPKPAKDPVSGAASTLIKSDDVELDSGFADLLNFDFKKPQPKGEPIVARNPSQKEKGAPLVAKNPNLVERGPDLDTDLFDLVVGEANDPSKNLRPRTETGVGFDFLLESDDSELI
jgi:hypothetical protein